VLAEKERLRQRLIEAEERARIASADYHQQQDAQREHEARYQSMTERGLAAEAELARAKDAATMVAVLHGMNEAYNESEANNKALQIVIRRLTEAHDAAHTINRQINIFALQQVERAMLLERAARRLVAAWRATRHAPLLSNALQGLLDEPYGCPMCDSGRLRNPAKEHWDDCPYAIARALLAAESEE